MNFKEKVLNILSIIGAWVKSLYLTVKQFVLANKKLSMIVAIAVAVIIVVLVVVFCIIIPKWNYSNKVVATIGGQDYTQSQIDAIADWWNNEAQVENEGSTPLTK